MGLQHMHTQSLQTPDVRVLVICILWQAVSTYTLQMHVPSAYVRKAADVVYCVSYESISIKLLPQMIEEIEERFSEEEITELLELVASILPDPAGQEAMDATASDDLVTSAEQ